MIEPAELLEDFGVTGIFRYDTLICVFSSNVLRVDLSTEHKREKARGNTDVFLLLIYMTNLEPNVGMG